MTFKLVDGAKDNDDVICKKKEIHRMTKTNKTFTKHKI